MSDKEANKRLARWRDYINDNRHDPVWNATVGPAIKAAADAAFDLYRVVGPRAGDYLAECARGIRGLPELDAPIRLRPKGRGGASGPRRPDADQAMREIYWRHAAAEKAGIARLNMMAVAREAKASIGRFRNTEIASVRRHLDRVLKRLVEERRRELAEYMARSGTPNGLLGLLSLAPQRDNQSGKDDDQMSRD